MKTKKNKIKKQDRDLSQPVLHQHAGQIQAYHSVLKEVPLGLSLKVRKDMVKLLNQMLAPSKERITNIVFMGMGEPLANYANVLKAIHILHDPKCLNIGGRRITVSTVGVPSKMRELAHEELPLNLAISLHAPNEKLHLPNFYRGIEAVELFLEEAANAVNAKQ